MAILLAWLEVEFALYVVIPAFIALPALALAAPPAVSLHVRLNERWSARVLVYAAHHSR